MSSSRLTGGLGLDYLQAHFFQRCPIAQRQHLVFRPQLPCGHLLSNLHMGATHTHYTQKIAVKMGFHKVGANFQCILTILQDGQECQPTRMPVNRQNTGVVEYVDSCNYLASNYFWLNNMT